MASHKAQTAVSTSYKGDHWANAGCVLKHLWVEAAFTFPAVCRNCKSSIFRFCEIANWLKFIGSGVRRPRRRFLENRCNQWESRFPVPQHALMMVMIMVMIWVPFLQHATSHHCHPDPDPQSHHRHHQNHHRFIIRILKPFYKMGVMYLVSEN